MNPLNLKKEIKEHLVNLTKELISFPSHRHEPLQIFELTEFIKRYFAKNKNIKIDEHIIDGTPSLVITTENTKCPHIMLSGHIDVVVSSSQYIGVVDGDDLYGSGSMDMKGGIACMMAIMKHFAEQKDPPSIGLMITSDEESGGEATRQLLFEEDYGAGFCIVNEGRNKYDIIKREKGMLVMKVHLHGTSLHSAYPWKGRNAVEEIVKLGLEVKKMFPAEKDGWIPTMSITEVSGDGGINIIPGNAEAVFSIRLTGHDKITREKIIKKIHHLAPDAQIEELVYGEVFQSDPRHPYMQLLKHSAEKVTKKPMKFGQNNGASDARFFMAKGIPTAVLGPVGHHSHSPREYVEVSSLVTHFNTLKRFIEKVHKKQKG